MVEFVGVGRSVCSLAYVYMPAKLYGCWRARAREGAWCVSVVRVHGAWAWCVGVVYVCVHAGVRVARRRGQGVCVRTDRVVPVFCLVLHVGGLDSDTARLLLGCLVNIVELQLLARAFQVEEHLPDTLQRQCPGIFSTSINSIFTFSKTMQRTYEMENVPW